MNFKEYLNEYLATDNKDGRIIKSLNLESIEGQTLLHTFTMFNRTQSMFKYDGLPNTITVRNLELLIQRNGYCGVTRVESKNKDFESGLYALYGTLGGAPSPYYMPTRFVYANAGLNTSGSLIIDKECVVIPNDSLYMGLLPIDLFFSKNLAHAYMTLKIALINGRMTKTFTAANDNVYKACVQYIEDIEQGKLGVIKDMPFGEELGGVQNKSEKDNSDINLTKIIEAIQFIKGSWFNELGLQSNFNMKRETLTESEVGLDQDIMLPLIDNMLDTRRIALDKINKMYDTNITVDLSSSWYNNKKMIDLEVKKEELEADTLELQSTETNEEQADELQSTETNDKDGEEEKDDKEAD